MTQSQNEEIVKEMYQEVLNRKNMEKSNVYISEEYLPKFNDANKILFKAFPDIKFSIKEIYSKENKVVTFYNWTGTHQNDYKNIPSTGKKINVEGVSIYVLQNGRIINNRAMPDKFMFFQQLGLIGEDLSGKNS